jgi:hypothetical protein
MRHFTDVDRRCIPGRKGDRDMPDSTPEAPQALAAAAQRHGFSPEAALTAWHALTAGRGAMAQFDHPELGGVGQWAPGGMTMVGDMFNHGLKARVDALCSELAGQMQRQGAARVVEPTQFQTQSQGHPIGAGFGSGFAAGDWWPAELGTPASSGAQNGLRYAYFPGNRRLAIQRNGRLELFDTGDHRISGVSQQQSGAAQAPVFSSDQGEVRVTDLKPVDMDASTQSAPAAGPPGQPTSVQPAPMQHAAPSMPAAGDPLALIERLAELRQKGIITEVEFTAKKTELLSRL